MPQQQSQRLQAAEFQSTPANTGGRCAHAPARNRRHRGFNPRPPILAGDASGAAAEAARVKFQSTPANTGGRCCRQYPACARCGRFNPRPPILAGDALKAGDVQGAVEFQSTPANTGGRCAIHFIARGSVFGFNPRPPILAGDARANKAAQQKKEVSIHARQYWRAMPALTPMLVRLAEFQSTPANTGGRCWRWRKARAQAGSFNPRPPILAGDAGW